MIQAQFETTPADIQAFQRFAVSSVRGFTGKASLGLSWRSIVLGIPVGIAVIIAGNLLRFTFDFPTAVVCAAIYFSFWGYARWRFARALPPAERGSLLGPRQTSLDEDGVREESPNHKHQSHWRGILSVEETGEHVFLMIDSIAGYIVPKRAFPDSERLRDFLTFAREHVQRHGRGTQPNTPLQPTSGAGAPR